MMRILLFLLTNLSVLLLISVTFRLFGIESMLLASGTGLDLNALLIFSALFGFGGAFISLAMSKWAAKRSMRVEVIETPSTRQERWLLQIVERQAQRAGIATPEVGIFPSDEVNAFATGMRRNNALVAVSSGLLRKMTQDEAEAVLGHEVAHVANGDMVTMGLLQGVLNTFVIFLSRVIGHTVDRVVFKNERGFGIGYFVVSMVAQLVLSILATVVVMWFSRWREFRADAGGANLAGRQKMVAALKRLQQNQTEDLPGEFASFGINGGRPRGLRALLMSHPPLEDRIAALQKPGVL